MLMDTQALLRDKRSSNTLVRLLVIISITFRIKTPFRSLFTQF